MISPAWAGPPFLTDDPEPVEYRHWEFYFFSQSNHVKGDTAGILPGLDANYGIIPGVHLHGAVSMRFDQQDKQNIQVGYGDTEIGAKCRFLDEDQCRPQFAVYPALEIPTGDRDKGFGTGQVRAFLPLWAQKSFGPWTTFGGGGYWFNPGQDNKDYWFLGWALTRRMTDKLNLGGEIFYQTKDTVDAVNSAGFNLGGIYDFTEHHHFLFSVGRGIRHATTTNEISYYVGYQLTF